MLADAAYALGAVVLLGHMIGPDSTAPLWTEALAAGAWFILCELGARAVQAAIRWALDR